MEKGQIDTDIFTLTRHMIAEQQTFYKEATGDFTLLMSSIQMACKFISTHVRKAGISNLLGLMGGVNKSGEDQKKLDVLANEVFINSLRSSHKVCLMASEEDEGPIEVDIGKNGKYIVAFDPLDGSSNIDANVSIGSIFSIWRRKTPLGEKPIIEKDLTQSGTELVSAGYCVTQIVISTGMEVNCYTLDTSIGEFVLTHPNLKIPKKGNIYSVNEGNSQLWDPAVKEYVDLKKNPTEGKKPYSLRYVGSMVADVHRTLLYGGIFLYPADKKSPNGKLRILYECYPMAYIMEKAGGKAYTGKIRVLEVVPKHVHDRCPVILGSSEDVDEILALYKKHGLA